MTDQDEPDERRTEGVRIIGAQEAAEAAGRPDVVRRRRGGEKRFGDRPDEPAPATDLPKITISTTEGDPAAHGDRLGSVPVRADGADESPRWADDDLYGPTDDAGERINVGHARIIRPESDDLAEEDDATPAEDPFGSHDRPDPFAPGGDPYAAYDDPYSTPGDAYAPADDPYAPVADDPYAPVHDEADPFAAPSGEPTYGEDDSFVLPHWTEPPTGQVPKVVIGEDAPEPEPLATYGNQPRWRDEGERTVVTDFDDLVDDGPRLGALAGGSVEDDFFSPAHYGDGEELDEEAPGDEDLYDDEPVDAGGQGGDAPRERPRRRPPAEPEDPFDGGGGGSGGDRNLVTAVAVGLGLVAVGLLCFNFGALPTALLATAVVTFAAFEYFTAVRTAGHNPATLLGLVAVAGLVFATYTTGLGAYPIVLGLTVITGLLWYLWVVSGEYSVINLGLTLLGVGWIGMLGSFATLFLGIGREMEDASSSITSNPGIGVLIAAVVVAVSHDVGAYFVGRYFGRTPLSAASPNKTQEGMIGGFLAALVVTIIVVGLIGIDPIGDSLGRTALFALLCAAVAPLGDLSESFVKRDLGVKDMGTVLPGHGGVLDRFDALLFVLPTAYFVTVLFDVWTLTP
ncbi:MAG: phosphatidate cytidylyltransferase [Microthrixaceae bacterium]